MVDDPPAPFVVTPPPDPKHDEDGYPIGGAPDTTLANDRAQGSPDDISGAVPPPATVLPPPAPTPFDAVDQAIERGQGMRQALLTQSLRQAAATSPAAHAAALTASQQSNIPADVAVRNPKAAQQEAYVQNADPDSLMQEHPGLAMWLSNPNHSAVASDDIESLKTLSHITQALAVPQTNERGQPMGAVDLLPPGIVPTANGGFIEPMPGGLANRYEDLDALSKHYDDIQEHATAEGMRQQAQQKRFEEGLGISSAAPAGPSVLSLAAGAAGEIGTWQNILGTMEPGNTDAADMLAISQTNQPGLWGGAMRMGGQMGADFPLLLAGGPFGRVAASLANAGRIQRLVAPMALDAVRPWAVKLAENVGQTVPIAAEHPLEEAQEGHPGQAMVDFLATSGIYGLAGPNPFVRAANKLADPALEQALASTGVTRAVAKLFVGAGMQYSAGAATVYEQALSDAAAKGKPVDWDQVHAQAMQSGLLMGAAHTVMGFLPAMAEKYQQDATNALNAASFADKLKMAREQSVDTTLQKVMPSSLTDALKAMQGDKAQTVFMQSKDWQDHWIAQGVDPVTKAEQHGLTDEFVKAQATQSDMAIPYHDFIAATNTSTKPEELEGKARQAPGLPSAEEGAAFYQNSPDEIAAKTTELMQQAAAAGAAPDPEGEQIEREKANEIAEARPAWPAARVTFLSKFIRAMFQAKAAAHNDGAAERGGTTISALDESRKVKFVGPGGALDSIGEVLDHLVSGKEATSPEMLEAMKAVQEHADSAGISINEQTKAGLANEFRTMMATNHGMTLNQPAIPAPEHGGLDRRSLKAQEALVTGKQMPPIGDPAFRKLAEQSDKVDEATDNPVMKALRNYESGGNYTFKGRNIVIADVPYGAGMSKDGQTVYIDRRIPRFMEINGQRVNVHELIADHEIDEHGHMAKGESYAKSHGEAVKAEDHDADKIRGITHQQYQKAVAYSVTKARQLATDKSKIPMDLEEKPYRDMGEMGLINGRSGTVAGGGGKVSFSQPERGHITFDANGNATIHLGPESDPSTVIHELAHYGVDGLGALAQRPDAAPQVVKDYATLLEYMGFASHADKMANQKELGELQAKGDAITDADKERMAELAKPHEKAAEAFETYAMTGKAPVPELKGVFRRIAKWMLDVYKRIDALGIKLNPQITGVFDRMLAGQDAIEKARMELGAEPIFKDAAQAGWTQERYDAYVKHVQTVADNEEGKLLERLQSEERSKAVEEVRSQATEQINNLPAFKAMHALQRGEHPDGTPLDTPIKIAKDDIVKNYGDAGLKALPGRNGFSTNANKGKPLYANEGGVSLEVAAQTLGFNSGDALYQALIHAPDRNELIDRTSEQMMAQKYPDLESVTAERAMEALHSDARSKLIETSMDALAAKVNNAGKTFIDKAGKADAAKAQASEAASAVRLRAQVADLKDDARITKEAQQGQMKLDLRKIYEAEQEQFRNDPDLLSYRLSRDDSTPAALRKKAEDTYQKAIEQATKDKPDKAVDALREAGILNSMATFKEKMQAESDKAGKAFALKRPPMELLRQVARDTINGQAVGSINPAIYEKGEARAAKDAAKAMDKKDWSGAFYAQQRRLLNAELFRAAKDAEDRYEKLTDYNKTFDTPAKRERLIKAANGIDTFTAPIDSLRNAFGLSRRPPGSVTVRGFIEARIKAIRDDEMLPGKSAEDMQMSAEDYRTYLEHVAGIVVSDRVADAQPIHPARDPKAMTVTLMDEVHGALKNIDQIARDEGKALIGERHELWSTLSHELQATALVNKDRPLFAKNMGDHISYFDKSLNLIGSIAAWHKAISQYAFAMDGYKDGGIWHDTLVRPLTDAAEREHQYHFQDAEVMDRLQKEWGKGDALGSIYRAKDYSSIIPGAKYSLMDRIVIGLNSSGVHNIERLRTGSGWTPKQHQAMLDTLDERDGAFIQGILDHFQSRWPELHAQEMRQFGHELVQRDTVPFQINGKSFKGGYFPIKYDPRFSAHGADLEAATTLGQQKSGSVGAAKTYGGMTKAVSDTTGMRLLLNESSLYRSLDELAHRLSHEDALVGIRKVMMNKDIKKAITESQGLEGYKMIRDGITDVARGTPQLGWNALNHLRTGVASAQYSFNYMRGLLDAFESLPQATSRVHPMHLAVATGQYLRSALSMQGNAAKIDALSSTMAARRRLQLTRASDALKEARVGGTLRTNIEYYAKNAMHMFHMATDDIVWMGAHAQAQAEHADDPAKAVSIANSIVRDTMGSHDLVDMAKVQRGNELMKMLTVGYGFFAKTMQSQVSIYGRARLENTPQAYGRMFGHYLMLYSLPIAIDMGLKTILRGNGNQDDSAKAIAKRFALEHLSYALSTTVIGRDISSATEGHYGYHGSAGERGMQSLYDLISHVSSGTTKGAVKTTVDLGGILAHLPAHAIDQILSAFTVASDKGAPAGARAMVFGRPPKK